MYSFATDFLGSAMKMDLLRTFDMSSQFIIYIILSMVKSKADSISITISSTPVTLLLFTLVNAEITSDFSIPDLSIFVVVTQFQPRLRPSVTNSR